MSRRKEVTRPRADDTLMTVPQVIAELGVSRRTFYRWRELGRAPRAIRLPNGELRMRRCDLEEWLHALREDVA